MQQVTEHVTTVMNALVENGKLESMIEEGIQDCLKQTIHDMFRSYGDFSKQLKEGLKAAIKLDFNEVSLPEYNVIILEIIKQETVKLMREEAEKTFLNELEKKLSPAPSETTVQDIVNCYLEEWGEDYGCGVSEHATVELEQDDSFGWWKLQIWKENPNSSFGSNKRSPDVHLHINKDGCIRGFHEGRSDLGTFNFGGHAKVYQMYAAGTKIIDLAECDTDDLNTYIRPSD